jgi:hypothetical protein
MRSLLFTAICLLGCLTIVIVACQPDDPPTIPRTGSLAITFDNVVGNQDLQLNSGTYQNAAGEQFSVSLLNYFVSNIRLQRANGTEYIVPQDSSYFLVREAEPASQTITLKEVPTGNYVSMSYVLGVDSLRSTMDISRRTGVLSPAGGMNGGMYWDWNSGYIFFKLEGTSPQAPIDPTGARRFQYHVGLFGGYDTRTLNNLRTITVPFGATQPLIQEGQTTRIGLKADVQKVFGGTTPVRIAQNSTVMVSPFSATIATNYASMFQYVPQTN